MRSKLGFLAFLLIACSLCWPSQHGQSFDETAAWKHVKILSDGAMEGRESGQRGYRRAEDYVAKRFQEWAVEPAGENGTYFQDVPFHAFRIKPGAGFEIIAGGERRAFPYPDGWRILPQSGSCRGVFDVVFAGYGISAPQSGYDDYQGLDVSGKLVLISDKVPAKLAAKAGKGASIEDRIAAARGRGARGIVFFNNSYIVRQYLELWTKPSLFQERFALIAVEDKAVDFMYRNMKKEGASSLQDIEAALRPSSYKMECRIALSVSTESNPKTIAQNVLAQIRGADDRLKNEYIVISAHLDHIGISPLGEIMHGANDNASGAAVVMETARTLKALGIKPKRTVIFALWAAEESGLLGSKHYSNHPVFPLEKTVANINLDMVGQGKRGIKVYGNSFCPDLWGYLMDNLPKETRGSVVPIAYSPGGSDHSSFLEKGVPGLLVQSEGPHFKIHRSQDTIAFIDPEALKAAGRFVLDAVDVLGFDSPDFIQPRRLETAQMRRQTYIDSRAPLLEDLARNPEPKDGLVDLKLAFVRSGDGLSGNALGLSILGKLVTAPKSILGPDSKGFYSSVNDVLTSDMRPGTATVLAGVQGSRWMDEDPQWGRILRKNDLAFVEECGSSPIFSENGMTKPGLERIQKLSSQGLAVILRDVTPAQAAAALQGTSAPLIIVGRDLPGGEIPDLIKASRSAIGLVYEDGDDPAAFMKKIERAKGLVGLEHVALFSRCSVEREAGRKALLDLMSQVLSSGYAKKDIYDLFAGSFLRVLCKIRGEEEPPVY